MNNEEIKKLNAFIKRYQEIGISIETMQKTIESLAEKRDKLFDELDELKQKEQVFMDMLIEKYGAAEITPNKILQYIENVSN